MEEEGGLRGSKKRNRRRFQDNTQTNDFASKDGRVSLERESEREQYTEESRQVRGLERRREERKKKKKAIFGQMADGKIFRVIRT